MRHTGKGVRQPTAGLLGSLAERFPGREDTSLPQIDVVVLERIF
ncbi:MAG: hypothetical protein R3D43_13360 [Tepidamorphaceae bacterium]